MQMQMRSLSLAFSLSRSRSLARAFSASLAIRAKPIGKTHFLILVSVFFACSNERLHTHRAMVTAPAVLAASFSLSSPPQSSQSFACGEAPHPQPPPQSSQSSQSPPPPRAERPSASSTVPRYFQSQVELAGKKRMNPENVAAIKNRFLELFVFRRPAQDERDLELCDCFNRKHFIVGTHQRALDLLEKYQPGDFHGPALYAYVISALGKNASLVEEVTSDQEHYMRIHRLAAKYNV
jgi:hypothetical protein